jgi:hypothetical protein
VSTEPFQEVITDALRALAPPGLPVDHPKLKERDGAGLYAFYGDPAVWQQLSLGSPADSRPLYVGKAEKSLHRRDLKTHFRSGKTGQSTLRRSLAALLRGTLHLKAQPRSLTNLGYYSNYSIAPDGDERLSEWMHEHLRLALWVSTGDFGLRQVERAVLNHWNPPLNGTEVKTEWSGQVSAARKFMADEARQWKS